MWISKLSLGYGSYKVCLLQDNGYERLDLDRLAERLRSAAIGRAEELLRQNASTSIPYIIVDLHGWVFMARYCRSAPAAGNCL